MTKCQTISVRKKIFHRFLKLRNIQFEKIKILKKKIFFEKFGQKIAFWPQISTQKARFGQKYFFRDPEAPRFPTRGHMPMFEKIRKNSIFRSKNSFLAPNFDPKGQIWPKIFFSWSWSPTFSNEGSHAYVWKNSKKFDFSVPKRVVGPEFWRTGIFGTNRSPSVFSSFGPLTLCQK